MNKIHPNAALIVIVTLNVMMFMYHQFLGGSNLEHAALPWSNENFVLYTLVTHMFSHSGYIHFLLNMFVIVSFRNVERNIGSVRFLAIYFVGGLVGYLLQSIVSNGYMLGASAGVMGIIAATAIVKPDSKVIFILYPFRPFNIINLVSCLVLVEIVLGIFFNTGIGHLAHVGGALSGAVITLTCPHRRYFFKKYMLKTKLWKYFI